MISLKPTREGYVEGILQAGRENDRVVVIEGDVSRSIGSALFGEEFPERFFNLGASEQDMLGEAAGLALAGFIPFVGTYGVFVAGRAWDQIRTSICYMNLNVKIAGAHGGVSVGPDGATHQALEDVALMRVLPNMHVLVPADANQTRAAVLTSMNTAGPVYIRFGRNPVPQIYPVDASVDIGKGHLLEEGSDITLVACGAMVSLALNAREILFKQGISAGVIDMVSVKPLDHKLLIEQAQKTGAIVVAEDHQAIGGLFGAVAETLAIQHPVPVGVVAVRDSFGTSGTPAEVREEYKLTALVIVREAEKLLEK
ncbi:MAG: transketolase family protein [Candidatus Fermentibacteraceae bacterium]|nr:transketolase family protein [Candidatus Fermentibacteraceae bacterium]